MYCGSRNENFYVDANALKLYIALNLCQIGKCMYLFL